MYTLGHTFKPATIHAGGLRYHGAGVVLSQLMKDGYMEAVDIEQNESFKAGVLFAQTEGIIPAPESCHAIAATVREALKCKETGKQKTILFNLSGHGFVDMAAYDQYISGELQDFHISDAELAKYMASADALNK
jgi:tryptophan synthase beta chain